MALTTPAAVKRYGAEPRAIAGTRGFLREEDPDPAGGATRGLIGR